ncbi:MAG: anti-sigma factor RsbA family regulatory protein, partial [Mycobacterium sp.]
MSASTAAASGFVHAALFYHSEQEYLDEVVPFILGGLASDQPVLVALPADNLALISDALGDAAAEVTMADLTDVGRNPGRILGFEVLFAAQHPGRQLRMVAEPVWPGRAADEYPACVQHEALVNTAFADHPAMGLCPFDAGRLDERVLADALTTHPLLWRAGSTQRSSEYAPEDALARYNQPLTNSTTGATYTVTKPTDLSAARAFAGRYADWLGLSADGIADLQLIVTELATNSLRHADSVCRLAFWEYYGQLVCEARDDGRLDDPLAGRLPPRPGDTDGRGLFLVNALADLVRSHTTEGGTTIQA